MSDVSALKKETDLTDAQIIELSRRWKEEDESQKRDLVGKRESSLQSLYDEYASGDVAVFVRKIRYMQQNGWSEMRRLRGDGDCFYRSFAYRYVEVLLSQGYDACLQAVRQIESLAPALRAAHFDPDITNDFAEPLLTLLKSASTLSEADLVKRFNDPEFSNSTVVFLRLITSCQVRLKADDFFRMSAIRYEDDQRIKDPETGLPSAEKFCQHLIEPIGRDADHLMIQALCQALQTSLSIAYLDQSAGAESGPPGMDGTTEVNVISVEEGPLKLNAGSVLLLRPGHYDILYKHV